MSFIKNREDLICHGNEKLRRAAIEIIEYALSQSDPYQATLNILRLSGDRLVVGDHEYNLRSHSRIFVVGGGKATYPIARALEEILEARINDGVIVCKYGQQAPLKHMRVFNASHPIPDQAGHNAAVACMNLVKNTGPGDIIFACFTGGSSALLPLPVDEITLEDKIEVNRLLLSCGANIYEINSVRKHLSKIKGGNLARQIAPGANLINLTVSDVQGDELDYITDLTVPDSSTFEDARRSIDKYHLWGLLPKRVSSYLRQTRLGQETAKAEDLQHLRTHNFILLKSDVATRAALKRAEMIGFNSIILSTVLEGESRELGITYGCIGREIRKSGCPVKCPGAVIGGGETTVKLGGKHGRGGPNQEFVLGAASEIRGMQDILVVGLDTDGTDGPSDLAGGFADGDTVEEAEKISISLYEELSKQNTSEVLEKTGNCILTGPTGTNVNDLKFMLVG